MPGMIRFLRGKKDVSWVIKSEPLAYSLFPKCHCDDPAPEGVVHDRDG